MNTSKAYKKYDHFNFWNKYESFKKNLLVKNDLADMHFHDK